MRPARSIMLMGALLLAGPVAVRADGIPWKSGEAAKDTAAAATTDLKAELAPARYNRVVKPIEAKLQAAQKLMATYEKEMAKDLEKRNQRLLVSCRAHAAEKYLGAAMAATRGIKMLKNESHKAAVKQQFEQSSRNKAIDLFLDLATSAHAKGDLRWAVAYYKRVLAVDKEHAEAKEGLVQAAKDAAARIDGRRRNKTSGDSEHTYPDEKDHGKTGRDNYGDWGQTGRGRVSGW